MRYTPLIALFLVGAVVCLVLHALVHRYMNRDDLEQFLVMMHWVCVIAAGCSLFCAIVRKLTRS